MSLLKYLFLENPIPLLIVLGLTAIVLFIAAFKRGSPKLLFTSVIVIALGTAVAATAQAVVTDREKLIALTHELVHATCPLDTQRLRDFFFDHLAVVGPNGEPWLDARQVVARLESLTKSNRIQKHQILHAQAQILSTGQGVSDLEISTSIDAEFGPNTLPTSWQIHWSKDPKNHWRIDRIVWLSIQHQAPSPGLLGG